MIKGCIYCGASENLNDSDIIPDALTGRKIINKCVCKTEHNNKFSDLFESKVIEDFSEITNNLNIKSSKSNSGKFASFNATLIIDGKEFPTKLNTSNNIINEKKLLKSEDGKTFLGDIDVIKKIAKDKQIETINLNELSYTVRTTLGHEIFISNEIFRLMAKIAFEWYCLKNTIENKAEEFNEIINFIITGEGNQIVTLVDDAVFYDEVMTKLDFGSHTLLSYTDSDGSISVLISFFGIVAYKVKVLDKQSQKWKMNFLFQTVTTYGTSVSFGYENFDIMTTSFENSFVKRGMLDGKIRMVALDQNDSTLKYKEIFLKNYYYISTQLKTCKNAGEGLHTRIKENYFSILTEELLTKKNLLRFIRDYNLDALNKIALEFKGTQMKEIFMFHILLLVGQNNTSISNIDDLNTMIGAKYGDNIRINPDFIEKIKQSLFENTSSDDILVGVKNILSWK